MYLVSGVRNVSIVAGIFGGVVSVCGGLDILEDIWSILERLIVGCKSGGCVILERLQGDLYEVPQELVTKNWFEVKQS